MTLKPIIYKTLQTLFIILVIGSVLLVGRMAFVMGMSGWVNQQAQKGTYDPAELYYLIQAFSGDFTEPYKAYYNAGTAYAQHNDYNSAELFLSTALAKVDYVYSECYIRNNLSIVYEKQGDYYADSELMETAQSYYDKAVQTVAEAPAACFPPPPPSGGGGGEEENESGEGGSDQESDSRGGEGLPDHEATPDVSSEGEQMDQTKESSQGKSDGISNDSSSGKEQVEGEVEGNTSDTSNKNDQEQQQENQPQQPVDKPW